MEPEGIGPTFHLQRRELWPTVRLEWPTVTETVYGTAKSKHLAGQWGLPFRYTAPPFHQGWRRNCSTKRQDIGRTQELLLP